MAYVIIPRHDTIAALSALNRIYAEGELILEEQLDGTYKLKVGNGTQTYNLLAYIGGVGGGGSNAFGSLAVTGQSTIVADTISDTLAVNVGAGLTATTNATTDTITITPLYGTTAGTICQGNDSRIGTGTPTAHASTHGAGGSDTIKLDALAAPDDVTTLNATTSAHGLLRKLSGNANQLLDGTGAWSGALTESTVKTYGAVGDGTTNDAAAFNSAAAAGDIIIPSGTYRIGTTTTLAATANLIFKSGASLTVDTGVTLTIRGVVYSGYATIFAGLGSVVGIRQARPEWWGAVGNGTTNDQPALQKCHDCVEASYASNGGAPEIALRGGANYGLGLSLHLRPTANINLRMVGAGPVFAGTRFTALTSFSTANGLGAIHIDGNSDSIQMISGFYIGLFTIIAGTATGALVGMWIGGNGTTTNLIGLQQNHVFDLHIADFSFGFRIANCRLINFTRCSAWTNKSGGVPILITIDGASAFTGDMDFIQCQFVSDPALTGKDVTITSIINTAQIKGIRFIGCAFYKANRFIEIYVANGGIIGDIWVVSGCQFDGFGNTMVYIEAAASSIIENIHIEGAYLRGVNSNNVAIDIVSAALGNVRQIYITTCWICNVDTNGTAIRIDNVRGLVITGNIFQDISASSGQAVLIDASTRFVFNNNVLDRTGADAAAWFITLGSGCDYFTILGNIGGGIPTTAIVRDLSGGANKAIVNNV